MIDKVFYLFWSGPKMSYMRYLTFASLRKHHPNWRIELHISENWGQAGKWTREKQDFQHDDYEDWLPKAKALVDVTSKYAAHPDAAPNHQSDFFRWEILKRGGFYLDNDQLILRPFDSALDYDFVYARVLKPRDVALVGVLGAKAEHPFTTAMSDVQLQAYDRDTYNSIGPLLFKTMLNRHEKTLLPNGALNGLKLFYPAEYADDVKHIYAGSLAISKEALALHWYGGHPLSNVFNLRYTPAIAKVGHDVISRVVRANNMYA